MINDVAKFVGAAAVTICRHNRRDETQPPDKLAPLMTTELSHHQFQLRRPILLVTITRLFAIGLGV